MRVSLEDIARAAGVSVKTVSGALHGGSARMAADTRERIQALATELGYVTNLPARGIRQGWLPLIGVVADGVITSPFATNIIRGLDGEASKQQMSVFVTTVSAARDAAATVAEVERFRPRAIAYAAMYHKFVELPEATDRAVGLLINCRSRDAARAALVPAERDAAFTITDYLLRHGRRRPAFLNLPGLLAGELREVGFRQALREHDLPIVEERIGTAVSGGFYSDKAESLVQAHIGAWLAGADAPDAILCGNDRIALEAYNALRRLGARIPDDVAIASFDNQVDIASRLDPPLTTMALPHREMGQLAADILLGLTETPEGVLEVPFRLVERSSV